MFSFRQDQFRAILRSILIADALSHRSLPACLQPGVDWARTKDTSLRPLPVAITSHRWCRQITHRLRHRTNATYKYHAASMQPERAIVGDEVPSEVHWILTTLPWFLQRLDNRALASLVESTEICHPHQKNLLAFYQGAEALLNKDVALAKAVWLSTSQLARTYPTDEPQVITLAFEHVFGADGDFSLTVGQSLKCSSLLNGLPILSSFLSACWIGNQGIPTQWCQALLAPTPSLQDWLQERWQISSISILDEWAEVLTDLWLGRHPLHPATHKPNALPAVQPIIRSTS